MFSCITVSAAFADRLLRAVLLPMPTIETTSSCSNTSRSTPSAAAPAGGANAHWRLPLVSTWTLS
eukprot:CAMPEP_0171404570 /NCGR_PEP_ID=MMETSP0880-20121228/14035_1 /TAXON_ID=67004 /ORGANISM="Thalassiosira weissflogii, Strain CCMP1336" /LENGTH=64 /DNA_ID=CAMNT_0011919821 /DNA_START=95 /DNA_END=286 /DNA_ORIENTATION=+